MLDQKPPVPATPPKEKATAPAPAPQACVQHPGDRSDPGSEPHE